MAHDFQTTHLTGTQPQAAGSQETMHAETQLARAGIAKDPAFRAVAPPLYLSSTYGWADPTEKPPFDYARSGNPTRGQLEATLADLEHGARGVVTATGMAAVDLTLCLCAAGDLVLVSHDCYGGTHRLLAARERLGHLRVAFVDFNDADATAAALAQKPKLVIVESPSNPLLRLTDIAALAEAAHAAGALLVADNTFLSPALQNPIDLGADIVVHSTTKYINGHSDVVGGAVIARDAALGDELAWWANCTGVTGSPYDAYQTLRGVRTLFARIERQSASAERLAAHLAADERVARVHYPGLASHPGHALARAQQKGFGAMFSVDLAEHVDALTFLRALGLFTTAESLGGFESLVCLPASMTHAAMPAEARARAGIGDRLVRFSIGLESADDLWRDIERGLDAAASQKHPDQGRQGQKREAELKACA